VPVPAAEPGRVRLGRRRQPAVKFAERFSVPARIRLTRIRGLKGTRHMARSRAVMNAPVTGGTVLVPASPPSTAGTGLHHPHGPGAQASSRP
jgi:hypothetical protein